MPQSRDLHASVRMRLASSASFASRPSVRARSTRNANVRRATRHSARANAAGRWAPPSRSTTQTSTASSRAAPKPPLVAVAGRDVTSFAFAAAGAALLTTVGAVAPLVRSLRELSASVDAAATAAESAANEVEALAKNTAKELPETLQAMEESAREVEALAAETREALSKLDATEYVESLVNDFTAKMKDPTKDFRDLGDDATEYVRRLSLELGLVMQSVGIYLDDGAFDEDAKNLSAAEKARRKNALTEAISAAKETTESAAKLSTQLQGAANGESKGRDLAEIVGKIALASKQVSTAMTRVVESTSESFRSTDE
jgi:hypothetical protein